jgi:hypothetical protein
MKKLSLTTVIFLFLLFLSNGIQAQTSQTKLNQVELAKQFLGTWQHDVSKDTVEIWEAKAYGKALIITNYRVVKGNKSALDVNNIGYDDRDDKIKGFILYPNTDFVTWIGIFTSDKLFKADALDTFKPEIVWWKNEVEFKTPTDMIIRGYSPEGIKTGEWTYKKVK